MLAATDRVFRMFFTKFIHRRRKENRPHIMWPTRPFWWVTVGLMVPLESTAMTDWSLHVNTIPFRLLSDTRDSVCSNILSVKWNSCSKVERTNTNAISALNPECHANNLAPCISGFRSSVNIWSVLSARTLQQIESAFIRAKTVALVVWTSYRSWEPKPCFQILFEFRNLEITCGYVVKTSFVIVKLWVNQPVIMKKLKVILYSKQMKARLPRPL